jgi:hypothetical protein
MPAVVVILIILVCILTGAAVIALADPERGVDHTEPDDEGIPW